MLARFSCSPLVMVSVIAFPGRTRNQNPDVVIFNSLSYPGHLNLRQPAFGQVVSFQVRAIWPTRKTGKMALVSEASVAYDVTVILAMLAGIFISSGRKKNEQIDQTNQCESEEH
jgi:hypothetical protein